MSTKKSSTSSAGGETPSTPVLSEDGKNNVFQEPTPGKDMISLLFQCGLEKEMFVFDGRDLPALKEQALGFLEAKFPQYGNFGLSDCLMLFKHNYASSNQLELINSIEDLANGDLLEIILKGTRTIDDASIRPHMLNVHSYKSPTFCDFCGVMLFGLVRQGLKCEGCGGNFHKRCAMKIPNNCSGAKKCNDNLLSVPRKMSDTWSLASGMSGISGGSNASGESYYSAWSDIPLTHSASTGRRATWSGGRPPAIDKLVNKLEIPHTFVKHNYKRPTVCHVCRKLLKGLFGQGFQCKDCKFNIHKRCFDRAPRNCLGEIGSLRSDSLSDADASDLQSETDLSELPEDVSDPEEGEKQNGQPENPAPQTPNHDQTLTNTTSNNIPLQRIVVSIKNTKRRSSKVLKQGWMVHYTDRDETRRKHYWRMDTKHLTLFQSDTGRNYYKDLPLSDILSIECNTDHSGKAGKGGAYVFSLKTNQVTYYCGEREEFDDTGCIIPAESDSGKGIRIGLAWAEMIKNALQPVCITPTATPTASVISTSTPPSGEEACSEKNVAGDCKQDEIMEQDISHFYQVFPDEILGSGQFGVVYGGQHRKTGREVAVKVIDKLRFPTKEERALKNEVMILQNIDHPAVVNLERMFETPERDKKQIAVVSFPMVSLWIVLHQIFVVMEKMKGDMLEMILNSPKGRLSERTTKFLVHQVAEEESGIVHRISNLTRLVQNGQSLVQKLTTSPNDYRSSRCTPIFILVGKVALLIMIALKYLHSLNVVHCDLKPENVLLSATHSKNRLPQVKLCDFGFARIIGRESFRRSVVGTPAYLAPEVLSNKRYNRSLDMWSVGVIIYVSLSGTFPFNEEEDIADQIKNAAFMYPPNPWAEVSREAIDLINKLLQVKMTKRLSCQQAMLHIWMQDYHTFLELRSLEDIIGRRYLTHETDDQRWERFAHAMFAGDRYTDI